MPDLRQLTLCIALLVPLAASAQSTRGLMDPTRPPNAVDGRIGEEGIAPGALRLNAVLRGSGQGVAVIGGRPVRLGERVDGRELIEIGESSVTLRDASGELVLELYRPGEKLPAKPQLEEVN